MSAQLLAQQSAEGGQERCGQHHAACVGTCRDTVAVQHDFYIFFVIQFTDGPGKKCTGVFRFPGEFTALFQIGHSNLSVMEKVSFRKEGKAAVFGRETFSGNRCVKDHFLFRKEKHAAVIGQCDQIAVYGVIPAFLVSNGFVCTGDTEDLSRLKHQWCLGFCLLLHKCQCFVINNLCVPYGLQKLFEC